MTDMHPHWHSTREKPDGQSAGTHIPLQRTVHVSRVPSAVLGILFVVLVGAIYTQGFSGIRGQLLGDTATAPTASGDVVIHLTKDGPSPKEIGVHPGATITWINDLSVPQILISDGLQNSDGTSLNTPAIAGSGTQSFTISTSQTDGSFAYGSLTSKIMRGTIDVKGPAVIQHPAAAIGTEGTSIGTPPEGTTIPGNGSTATGAVSQDALIPRNPYTVSRNIVRPLDQNGQPWTNPNTAKLHGGAPLQAFTSSGRPIQQPESGPETWVVFAIAGAVILIVAQRKSTYYV